MSTFIPKNAGKILKNPQMARQFFLKPYGLDIPKNQNFPKKHPQYKFFEHKILLKRPGKDVPDNALTFKINERLSKPELKQYLEKLYGIDIEQIGTVRYMGRVKRNVAGAPMVTPNFKKAYVMTSHKIDPVLNGIICE